MRRKEAAINNYCLSTRVLSAVGLLVCGIVIAAELVGIGFCGSCSPTNPVDGETMATIEDTARTNSNHLSRGDLVGIVNSNQNRWGLFSYNPLSSAWEPVSDGEGGADQVEQAAAIIIGVAPGSGGGSTGGGGSGGFGSGFGGGFGGGSGGTRTWHCGSGTCCNSSGTCVSEESL